MSHVKIFRNFIHIANTRVNFYFLKSIFRPHKYKKSYWIKTVSLFCIYNFRNFTSLQHSSKFLLQRIIFRPCFLKNPQINQKNLWRLNQQCFVSKFFEILHLLQTPEWIYVYFKNLFFVIPTGSGGGKKVAIAMGLKLYHISDSPPCLAVRMALAYLGLQVELVDIDFLKAEQASELYKKVGKTKCDKKFPIFFMAKIAETIIL